MEVTKYVTFQSPMLMGFKVGIFRISPIGNVDKYYHRVMPLKDANSIINGGDPDQSAP